MSWFRKSPPKILQCSLHSQRDGQEHTSNPDTPSRTVITSKGRVIQHSPIFPGDPRIKPPVPAPKLVHTEERRVIVDDDPDPLDSLIVGIAIGEILADSSSMSDDSSSDFSGGGGSFGGGGSQGDW